MADAASTGVLRGNTITLDAPVPPLEGKRVRVVITPTDEDLQLSASQQGEIWRRWAERGPQGPIADEDEPEFP
jgi:hypothetical protein